VWRTKFLTHTKKHKRNSNHRPNCAEYIDNNPWDKYPSAHPRVSHSLPLSFHVPPVAADKNWVWLTQAGFVGSWREQGLGKGEASCHQPSPWDFFLWPQGNLIGGALIHVVLDSIMMQLISIHVATKKYIYGPLTVRLPYVCFLGYRFSQLVVRLFPVVVRVLHVGRGEVWGAAVGTCNHTVTLKI